MKYKAYGEENHTKHASHTKKIQNKKVELGKTLAERGDRLIDEASMRRSPL